MASNILTGAHIQVYVNDEILKEAQSVTLDVDYGEQQTRGIDSPYAQEIAVTSITVTGQISMVRQKNSGGTQAKSMRPLSRDVAAGSYISIRVHDRQSGEDIVYLPQAKIIKETHAASTKSTYKVTVAFSGVIPLFALDRAT